MIDWFGEPRRQQARAARRTLQVTLALSLLVHVAALIVVVKRAPVFWPDDGTDAISDRLQVRLAATRLATPSPPPVPSTEPSRATIAKAQPSRARVREQPPAAVLASPSKALPLQIAPEPALQRPSPSQEARPIEGDLWSYIQARRRERGASVESLVANSGSDLDASLAANLPRPATGTATRDLNRGGGIFEIKRMTYDDAAFFFFGWNRDMGRRTPQLITVRIGANADMRIAVVRSMIAVIRQYTQADFFWRSAKREDSVLLSARPSDTAALETFLLREFFDERGEPH